MKIEDQIDRLQKNGWQMHDYTMTGTQTYLYGILFALPFLFLTGGLYRAFLLKRAVLLDHTGLVFLAAIIVSVTLHEGLHGLGWRIAGRLDRKTVSFLFRSGLPMCSCKAVLPVKAYLAGVLLPFLLLGGGSILFLVICPGTISLLAALVNLTLPGADLAIAFKVLKSGAVMIADCPDQAGFTGFHRDMP